MFKSLRSVRNGFGFVLTVLAVSGAAAQPGRFQTASTTIPAQPAAIRVFLDKYCVTCHNERLHTGGLVLENIDVENVGAGAAVWERVIRKLRARAMPPARAAQPDQAGVDGILASLERALDAASIVNPNPGRVGVHRLNRTEYTNAIRDLLALDIDSRTLIAADDAGEEGFDNMAGSLSVSPALVERYISAARKISNLAVGDSRILPAFETYSIPKMLNQDGRVSEDLPFGTRGGIAVRHRFPVNGEYIVRIRLRGQLYDYVIGMGRPHPMELRLDGQRLKVFTVGGDAPGKPAPSSFAGNIPGDPAWEEYMHAVNAGLEFRFPARAGDHFVGVSFVEFTPEPEGVLQPPLTGKDGAPYTESYYGNPELETVSIGGPFSVAGSGDTASRRRIFVCQPARTADERVCANKILSALARRAFRRPVTNADVQMLLGFYDAGRKQGSFESGIESALTRILVDPEFLFRIQRDPADVRAGSVYRVTDLELASRLSFFVWSSIPDDELLDVAARGKLRDPEVLSKQVKRMLEDSRSKALVDNFANQWLGLPKLRGASPDPDEFPDFDENLRDAFQKETELFLRSQVRENRSVLELLRANYTFVNDRLARHYEIPNIYGEGFRRVTFRDNDPRGGLLGQGSILLVTSYANRTSPVLRGKWLLDNILGMPPPPPPPNVPELKEPAKGKPVSMRERMAQHRDNPVCATCHSTIDPLGFSLENFDAIGKWRTTNDGAPIDASGALPDGAQFQGVLGLRNSILKHRDQFVQTLVEKLMTYALGRGLEDYDYPAVRKITRDSAAQDFRWASLIEGIAKSVPFQMAIAQDIVQSDSMRKTAQ